MRRAALWALWAGVHASHARVLAAPPAQHNPTPLSTAVQEDGQWVQFDDDKMILRKEEEVLTLSGTCSRPACLLAPPPRLLMPCWLASARCAC